MTALFVILGVLLFLLLLTAIPVRVEATFREEFFLTVRWLFLSFPLAPAREKPEKEGKKAKKEKAGEKGKASGPGGADKLKAVLKETGFGGFLRALFGIVKAVASSSKKLISHVKLKRFDLYLCLAGGEDAAEAAVRYGQLSGAVYSACGLFFSLVRCKDKRVTVDLDYTSRENRVDFSAKASLRPMYALKEGLVLLFSLLGRCRPLLKALRQSGGAPDSHTTSTERISQTRKQGN